jgi:Fic family protein
MDKNKQKLVNALEEAENINIGTGIVEGTKLKRQSRELLEKTGWLTKILRGWYIMAVPKGPNTVTAIWYSNYWDFLNAYLSSRFGNDYCLSPVDSLTFHSQDNVLPESINVYTKRKSPTTTEINIQDKKLKIVTYYSQNLIEAESVNGLRVLPIHISISCLPGPAFETYELSVNTLMQDPVIQDHVKQYINNQDKRIAQERLANLLGLQMPKTNIQVSPAALRIKSLWSLYEPIVNQLEANAPFKVFSSFNEVDEYIDKQFNEDSYNSLTIEGYEVTPELIQKVINGEVDFSYDENKLAALGYSLAYQKVKEDILSKNLDFPDISEWRMLLFKPNAEDKGENPIGGRAYRKSPVYISNSKHVPVNFISVIECMDMLKTLTIGSKAGPVSKAILTHMFLCYIHPWQDGNGRTSRFLMNYFLCSAKLPWLIIKREEKDNYFRTLEIAQTEQNINPFANFIMSLLSG